MAVGLVLAIAIAEISRAQARDRRSTLARMAAPSLLAFGLTLCVAPRTNRIYYDEQIYQSIGQNLADLRLAQMCNDGIVEYGRLQCSSGEYNKQPYAYPHLLSLGVSAVRRASGDGVRRQRRRDGGDGVRGVSARAVCCLPIALAACSPR